MRIIRKNRESESVSSIFGSIPEYGDPDEEPLAFFCCSRSKDPSAPSPPQGSKISAEIFSSSRS